MKRIFFSPPNYPQSDSSRVAFMNKKKVLFTNLLMILKSSPSILVLFLVFLKLLLIVHLKTHFDSRFSKDSLIHSYNLSFFFPSLCVHMHVVLSAFYRKSLIYTDHFCKGLAEQLQLYSLWLLRVTHGCTSLKYTITLSCLHAVRSRIITINVQLLPSKT